MKTLLVAKSFTERVIPPCHHWSWSSMKVASDHFVTSMRTTLLPRLTKRVTSNSAARRESFVRPTSRPLINTTATDS